MYSQIKFNKLSLISLIFIFLFFTSCDILQNNNSKEVFEVEQRIIESPIDLKLEIKGDTNELSYMDTLNLFLNYKNNADKNISIGYQIGYNYLKLEEGKNNDNIILEKNQKEFFNHYFSVLPLDYNLEYIDLNYYYCYNYNYSYDLYLEMYDDKGVFIEDNIVDENLNDMISDIIVDKVEIKNRNGIYLIEIYFKKNVNDYAQIVKEINYDSCSYDYNDKNIVRYDLKINDQEISCYFNMLEETNLFSFYNSENPKIICEYENPQKISLNLDLNLEYGFIGEIKNRLGVKIE